MFEFPLKGTRVSSVVTCLFWWRNSCILSSVNAFAPNLRYIHSLFPFGTHLRHPKQNHKRTPKLQHTSVEVTLYFCIGMCSVGAIKIETRGCSEVEETTQRSKGISYLHKTQRSTPVLRNPWALLPWLYGVIEHSSLAGWGLLGVVFAPPEHCLGAPSLSSK